MAQRDHNPFPYSDSNKRYHTYEYHLRQKFGSKCAKLPLDGGFTCPNIDGACGTGGCIYCSDRGSGDFSLRIPSIAEQIRLQKQMLGKKWSVERCIAYFQAHTNTYAPVDRLKELYDEAIAQEGIVGLDVATRADCLSAEVLSCLSDYAERTALTVELGLQSSNDRTAKAINRCHSFAQFRQGYDALKAACPTAEICIHIIFGLPGEAEAEMLQTVKDVAALHPHQVKIHLLHVLKGTKLAELYKAGEYQPLEQETYIRLVADALELLPPETVICRLTGDGKADDLIAPMWSRQKLAVINGIDRLLYQRNSYQGSRYISDKDAHRT